MKIKILFNEVFIKDKLCFDEKILKYQSKYGDKFSLEENNDKKFDLLIDDKIVYTLDDSFDNDNNMVSTDYIFDKVDRHIYNAVSSKRKRNISKFDDIDLIDY